ncbi:MAG: leucyl aminopeptidase [Elusimicrobiota bacterium]|jgi:leucyl aminopeptidase
MKITVSNWKNWKDSSATLAVLAFQEETPRLLGLGKEASSIALLAKADGFKAKERETFLLHPVGSLPAARVLLIGLGKKTDFNNEVLRQTVPQVLRRVEDLGLKQIALRAPQVSRTPKGMDAELQTIAEGLWLASYRFDKHRKVEEPPVPVEDVTLWLDSTNAVAQKAVERGRLYAQATMRARDLINEPPSRMNPERLAEEALLLNKAPVSVRVFDKKELEKMGMGALLGVGAGGAVPPRLVEMIYKPAKKARKIVALVGKGITFDSGGLSLKPAQSMETMKDDMSGAAAVLGVFNALAELKPSVEVRGYLALAENMPGGRALKPGDVLKTHKGKTIEVLNTDAEGRLVLADALSYASAQKPDILIDIATLTGACTVALGHRISAIMTETPALARSLASAGTAAGEKFWELPLEKEYKKDIKSKIADVKNIGSRRGEAGTIIGGLFLQEFVECPSWAHIDIAGPSWTDSDQPYCPTGGTGHPVRTLLHYLENI